MLPPNGPFASNSNFRPKIISKVAIIKTKSKTIAFFFFSSFPSPRSFFFSFPFPSLVWFWSFSGLRNMPFGAFSLKRLQISLGWFSKNRLDIYMISYGLNEKKKKNRHVDSRFKIERVCHTHLGTHRRKVILFYDVYQEVCAPNLKYLEKKK